MYKQEIEKDLNFARYVVQQAGEIALRGFRKSLVIENKLEGFGFDPVTLVDQEVEAFIRQKLMTTFPNDSIIGEESGKTSGLSDRTWIIDPIDGTRAFISGVPTWGVLLGLQDNDRCVGGIMHQPYLGETFFAVNGAAWMSHHSENMLLHSNQEVSLEQARLYCTHPDMFSHKSDLEAFQRVATATRLMLYGGDCYSYCMLAMGQIDLVIEGSLQPYDIIPLIPIIEGSGGVVTDIYGNCPLEGGLVIAAANKKLHQQAMELMHQQ